jgi:hypothetical protein
MELVTNDESDSVLVTWKKNQKKSFSN